MSDYSVRNVKSVTARASRGCWSPDVATPEEIGLQVIAETGSKTTERVEITCFDGAFLTRGPATGKARSPTAERRVRPTISDDEAERRRCRASESADRCSSSARHGGAVPCRQCTRVQRIWTRSAAVCGAFTQWSWRRSGVTDWRGRTLRKRTPASGRVHHPTIIAWLDTMECRRALRCRSPAKTAAVTKQKTMPTVERILVLIGRFDITAQLAEAFVVTCDRVKTSININEVANNRNWRYFVSAHSRRYPWQLVNRPEDFNAVGRWRDIECGKSAAENVLCRTAYIL